MVARYVIHNGKIADYEDENHFAQLFLNKHFLLSEEIWFCKGAIPLFNNHMELIHKKITAIGENIPEFFNNPKEILRLSLRLINKNKAFNSGRIILKLIWQEKSIHYLLICFPEKEKTFPLSKQSLLLTYSKQKKQSQTLFSHYDFGNQLFWKHLDFLVKESKKDGLIVLNETNNITELRGANIYFIKENTLLTPSADTGCYIDPIRNALIKTALNFGFEIVESSKITKQLVLTMDEAFAVSELSGFQKIIGIDEKRFLHIKTVALYEELVKQLIA